MDNINNYLSEILFLWNLLPGVRDRGESSVPWSLAGLILVFWRVTHSKVSQLLYALGKQLKLPLKVLKIEMLEEQAAQYCSVKAIFLEPLVVEK